MRIIFSAEQTPAQRSFAKLKLTEQTEIAMSAIQASKFPVQQMVTHTFPLDETEKFIRAGGGEIPGLYPVKAVIKP